MRSGVRFFETLILLDLNRLMPTGLFRNRTA